jgi:D-galactarolactone cycloisomerase
VFAGSLFVSRGRIRDQVEFARRAGLAGAKVKIGFGIEKDRKLLRDIRSEWPEAMLVADANGAYAIREAERACAAFRELSLAWFEEPLMPDDWSGYMRLGRQKQVRIGAGESWFLGDLTAALEAGLVDVIEPSVSRCGGVGVELHTGRLAAKRRVGFSPMTGFNSAISLAASLHIAAVVPSVGVEYNPFKNPLQSDLGTGISEPESGVIEVPRGYGLGVEVDMDFVRKNNTQREHYM